MAGSIYGGEQDLFPIGAAWFYADLGDKEADDAGEGDVAGGEVKGRQSEVRDRWATGEGGDVTGTMNMWCANGTDPDWAPVIGQDLLAGRVDEAKAVRGDSGRDPRRADRLTQIDIDTERESDRLARRRPETNRRKDGREGDGCRSAGKSIGPNDPNGLIRHARGDAARMNESRFDLLPARPSVQR